MKSNYLSFFFRGVIWVAFLNAIQTYGQDINGLLKNTSQQSLDSVSGFQKIVESKLWSTNPEQNINDYLAKLTSLKSKLTSKIDSVKTSSGHDSLSSAHLSDLKNKLDSLNNLGPPKLVLQGKKRIEIFDQKVSDMIDTMENKINQKLSLFSNNGGHIPSSINLPGGGLNTPLNFDPELNIDPKLISPTISSPSVGNPLSDINTPDIGVDREGLGDLPNLPNVELKEIKALQNVTKVQDKLGGIDKAGDQLKGYQDDLKTLQEGDLSQMQELPDAIE